MERDLSLRIVLEQPPVGVDFGLQKGSGNHFETVQAQRSNGQSITFDFTVRVKGDDNHSSLPNFLGAYVQGPPNGRFVYLDIGKAAGQMDSMWSRRMKISLAISWELIHQLDASQGGLLEVHVAGTGKDGSPACATVKPLIDWSIRLLYSSTNSPITARR